MLASVLEPVLKVHVTGELGVPISAAFLPVIKMTSSLSKYPPFFNVGTIDSTPPPAPTVTVATIGPSTHPFQSPGSDTKFDGNNHMSS